MSHVLPPAQHVQIPYPAAYCSVLHDDDVPALPVATTRGETGYVQQGHDLLIGHLLVGEPTRGRCRLMTSLSSMLAWYRAGPEHAGSIGGAGLEGRDPVDDVASRRPSPDLSLVLRSWMASEKVGTFNEKSCDR